MSKRKYYRNTDAVVEAYVDQTTNDGRNPGDTVFFDDEVIYSYGPHFPMGIRLEGGFFLLNGDRYSSTTGKHQAQLRGAIPGSERVEVPFSALVTAMVGDRRFRYRGMYPVEEMAKIQVLDFEPDVMKPVQRQDKDGNWYTAYDHTLGGALLVYQGRKFVSSMDASGTGRGLYFLTELKDADDISFFGDGLESLKPDIVRAQEDLGVEVKRQGEFFFVEVPELPLMKVDPVVQKSYVIANEDNAREAMHVASEGFVGPEGMQFVRGQVKHARKEHKVVKLYDKDVKPKDRPWFMVVENVQVQSWGAAGNVD